MQKGEMSTESLICMGRISWCFRIIALCVVGKKHSVGVYGKNA
jgi:hypothetical protein